jgi:Xaa-Pro aminopeptidase
MRNLLIYAAGEHDSNIFYATRFPTPDPYLFIQTGKKKVIVVSDLEYSRALKEATVDEVLRSEQLKKEAGLKRARPPEIIFYLLSKYRIKNVVVPADFPLKLADRLRKKGIKLICKDPPFFKERQSKSKWEINAIRKALKVAEEAIDKVVEILRRSRIVGRFIHYKGEVLTSEYLRYVMNLHLISRNYLGGRIVVACGNDACDPHSIGHGPIRAGLPIVVDLFPRSLDTFYWADITRTFIKGVPSKRQHQMYEAVCHAQEVAFKKIRAGIDGKKVHKEVQRYFKEIGFKTGLNRGRMEGFIHGTGHGIGLDIHELPSISKMSTRLVEGAVVTVEPGLYYFNIGGIRLEDMVVVKKRGCIVLTRYPKIFRV